MIKRMLSLLCAVVMCTCLCACNRNIYDKYADIVELLEAGDYDGAHKAIDALAGGGTTTTATNSTQETSTQATTTTTTETTQKQTVFYIHTAEELFAIDDSAEKTYILENDIDLTGYTRTIPELNGVFDGNGKSLRNATAPLFQYNKGTIQNVTMLDCRIALSENAAAVAVENSGMVFGCTVSGTIDSTAENAHAGGIVCTNNSSGTIEKCVNNAAISATSYALNDLGNVIHGTWALAGGICANNSGNISCCYNTGTVSSRGAEYISAAGGLIAGNTGGEITNCYNTGTITSSESGGIAGFSDFGRFVNCYNIGTTSSGIIGDNRDYIIDCYYLDSVSSNGSGSGLHPEGERFFSFTDGQLNDQSTFSTFDFDSIWTMSEHGPVLR